MKTILILLLSFFSISAFADWKIQGDIFFRGSTLKLDQRIKPKKKYEIKKDRYFFIFDAEEDEETKEIIIKCHIHEALDKGKGEEKGYFYQRTTFSTKVVKDDDKSFGYNFIINHILE